MHSELHIGILVIGLAGVEESVGGASARLAVPQAFLEDTRIVVQIFFVFSTAKFSYYCTYGYTKIVDVGTLS